MQYHKLRFADGRSEVISGERDAIRIGQLYANGFNAPVVVEAPGGATTTLQPSDGPALLQPLNDKSRLVSLAGNVKVIYDCGSRDALDGLDLAILTGASELHIFECNPESFKLCETNVAKHAPPGLKVFLNPMAIDEQSGSVSFFPIDTEKTITAHADGNPGASSLLLASGKYPHETYVQKQIPVPSTSLDDYCATHSIPDLLWLDLQGAELQGLRGARRILGGVKVINMEVAFREMYSGQAMYWDIEPALKGFRLADLDLGRWPKLPRLYSLLRFGPWGGNAIFVRK